MAKPGSGEGEYLLYDQYILWHASNDEDPKLAIPKAMIPRLLALVHSTFGHPGVAGTKLLIQGKYSWFTLVKDVR